MGTRLQEIKGILSLLWTDEEPEVLQMRSCMGETFVLVRRLKEKFLEGDEFRQEVKAKVSEILNTCSCQIRTLYMHATCKDEGYNDQEVIQRSYFDLMNMVLAKIDSIIQNYIWHRQYEMKTRRIAAKQRLRLRSSYLRALLTNKIEIMLVFDNELDIWECAATLMIGIIALNKLRCDELKLHPSKGSVLEETANHWNRMMTLQCRYLSPSVPRNMTMGGVSVKTQIHHNNERKVVSTIDELSPVNYQKNVQNFRTEGSSELPKEYHNVAESEEEYQEDFQYLETEDSNCYTPAVGNEEDWQILFYEINPNIPKDEAERVFVTTYILHNINPTPESITTVTSANEDDDEYQKDLQGFRTEEYEDQQSDLRSVDSRCFIFPEENEENWHGSLDNTSQNISVLELESNGSLRNSNDDTPLEDFQVDPHNEELITSVNTSPIKYLCMGLTFGERRQSLLHWCKVKLHPYGIPICDFTASWKSGRALVALIHCYHKYFIGDRFLTKESPRNTLDWGEKFARSLGVSCSTDFVEECLKKKPSQFKIMPFVEELRTCLEATRVRN